MAEILWDKKTGTYDLVDSDYLTPEPHAHNIGIDLEIDVYMIWYDVGRWEGEEKPGIPPKYVGQLKGQVTSANLSIDSTSDMRSTCTLSIILEEDSPFIVHSNDATFWQTRWLKITKKYNYLNDLDMYPMFDWGNRVGLWNNNGLFRSDPSQFVVGWFVPNDGSYSYNAETREFSLSCTDIMSFMTEARGGHLTHWSENFLGAHSSLDYFNYGSTTTTFIWSDTSAGGERPNEDLRNDIYWTAANSSGILLEGEQDLQIQDKQYANHLALQKNNGKTNNSVSAVWKDKYETYLTDNSEKQKEKPVYDIVRKDKPGSVSDLVRKLIRDYTYLFPVESLYISLQNDYKPLPYDLDFNGDVTLYEVMKKITDLYPRQTLYFDANKRLNVLQTALAWGDIYDSVDFRAREFMGLVLEEHWNVDLSNVKNYVVVFGRDNSCSGYYWITSQKGICPNCGKVFEYFAMPVRRFCPICSSKGMGTFNLIKLFATNDAFCVPVNGTHKYVVYDDNLITEEECFDAAKAITLQSCRAAKTLSVTLVDRYLSMYQWADKGVGRRIEYKSKITGETDVYTLLKWTNNFESGTVTLELEPYYTCRDEYFAPLQLPEFIFSVDENGLMTMIINNKKDTPRSLFKIYGTETSFEIEDGYDFWNWHYSLNFWGETCEVYSEATETEYQTKIYRHQFTHNGRYLVTCQAWSPNVHPSGCRTMRVVEVSCFEERLLAENGNYLLT